MRVSDPSRTYPEYRSYTVIPTIGFELLSDSPCSLLRYEPASSADVSLLWWTTRVCFKQLTLPRSRASAGARLEGAGNGDQEKIPWGERFKKSYSWGCLHMVTALWIDNLFLGKVCFHSNVVTKQPLKCHCVGKAHHRQKVMTADTRPAFLLFHMKASKL